jgi:large subunit ribosomal protein L29
VPLKKEKEELRHKTIEELEIALREAKKQMFDVRTNIATRKEEDNNRSRVLKRRVARILTMVEEKRREAAAEAAAAGGNR